MNKAITKGMIRSMVTSNRIIMFSSLIFFSSFFLTDYILVENRLPLALTMIWRRIIYDLQSRSYAQFIDHVPDVEDKR